MTQISQAETTGETPSLVRSRPWTIQGWRPTSVAVQPMLMAMMGSGKLQTSTHSIQRAFSRRFMQMHRERDQHDQDEEEGQRDHQVVALEGELHRRAVGGGHAVQSGDGRVRVEVQHQAQAAGDA